LPGAAVLILLLFVSPVLMGSKPMELPPPETEEERPRYSLNDVLHYHYQDGVLRLEVSFTHGDFFSEAGELRVENCRFVYYDETGAPLSRGNSNRATLFENQSRLVAQDDVVVFSEVNGGTLTTEHLVWEGSESRFTTEEEVVMTRKNGDILQGEGMVADVALNYVVIKRNVHGRIRSE
jgi:LPS export ABC transporter protein LptC